MSNDAHRSVVRRELRRARRRLREQWAQELADEEALTELDLRSVDGELPSVGSRPQIAMVDRRQREYLFKLAPLGEIAAELLAARLRRLGRQLHVPAARRSIELADGTTAVGLVQPKIGVEGTLAKDPGEWTPLQRLALLRDHPWEWLLANLDTHIDQYVLVGRERVPLNIDWDHSLVDLATTELTRFNARSAAVIPIRNLLYAEYVAGAFDLDFYPMQVQARRIGRIPFHDIERLLRRWASEAEVGEDEREAAIEAMRQRHARIVDDFDRLVEGLRRERVGRTRRSGWPAREDLWDAWQRFVLLVLHDRVVRPTLSLRRRLARR